MSHIQVLIQNQVRESLERLQKSGVGFIDSEDSGGFWYRVDGKSIRIDVQVAQDEQI